MAALAGCKDSPTEVPPRQSSFPSCRLRSARSARRLHRHVLRRRPAPRRHVTGHMAGLRPCPGQLHSGNLHSAATGGSRALGPAIRNSWTRWNHVPVDPAQPARRVYFLSGIVKDESSGAVLGGRGGRDPRRLRPGGQERHQRVRPLPDQRNPHRRDLPGQGIAARLRAFDNFLSGRLADRSGRGEPAFPGFPAAAARVLNRQDTDPEVGRVDNDQCA